MGDGLTLAAVRARTYKARDSWWTVFLVDPLASRLVWLVARYAWITPNRLTIGALALGLGAAAAFAGAAWPWLVVGAVIFHLSFVVDCMDGKVARLNGNGSVFGAWLDYILDRVRVLICTIALMGGQYAVTGDITYLVLGGAVVFLDMFRYLNALQLSKTKIEIRESLAAKVAESGAGALTLGASPAVETIADPSVVDITRRPELVTERDFRSRFSAFTRFRDFLVRNRVRVHVMSGIEFQMAVFIVGPLTGAIIPVTVGAGLLLLAFEFALIYKLWLSAKAFDHHSARLAASASGPMVPQQPQGAEAPAPRQPEATTSVGNR